MQYYYLTVGPSGIGGSGVIGLFGVFTGVNASVTGGDVATVGMSGVSGGSDVVVVVSLCDIEVDPCSFAVTVIETSGESELVMVDESVMFCVVIIGVVSVVFTVWLVAVRDCVCSSGTVESVKGWVIAMGNVRKQ